VIKDSAISKIGNGYYPNHELAVQMKPSGWKIKNSPAPKDL
jgi:hypothetical protein